MDFLIIFYILVILGIGAVIFLLLRKKTEMKKEDNSLIMLQNQLNHISQALDSKISYENYNRMVEEKNPSEKDRLEKTFKADLKMRIDETSKYVNPSEDTMEFAFMFIPHEAIYYDLLINQVG